MTAEKGDPHSPSLRLESLRSRNDAGEGLEADVTGTLHDHVAAELSEAVDPRVSAMAAALAARYPRAARAVLFYGSCLRAQQLDGQMLDFYLIVSSYADAYGKSWLAAANRLIPPNVFPFHHEGMAAKFAVLSEEDFARECGPRARSVSVWARFAQPSRLAWSADPAARTSVVASIATAAPTLLSFTVPLKDAVRSDVVALWKQGFSATYRAELRAERSDRSEGIVDADPARYRRFGDAALRRIDLTNLPGAQAAASTWTRLQRRGKLLSVLRLVKASFTFAGGIDYLAWKVSRHSGQPVTIKPWHRRAPLVAAIVLLPRLLARGAVR